MYVYQNYAVSFIQEPENISHLTELGAIVLPGLRLASVKYLHASFVSTSPDRSVEATSGPGHRHVYCDPRYVLAHIN